MKHILIILELILPMLTFAQHSLSEIKMKDNAEVPYVDMSVQLYSLRSLIGTPELFAKNHEAVLRSVAEMGFSGVEAASYEDGLFSGLSPLSFRQEIEKAGLKIVSSHATHPLSEEELKTGNYSASLVWWDKCIAAHKEAGITTLVMSWSQPLNDIHQISVMSQFLNAIGQHCQAAGIRFGYHSHSHEFKKVDGTTMMDEFISNTVSENVFFEMDVYWAVVAGVSPVEYMQKYPGRFSLLHIKDKYEIGQSGMVRFEPIFRNMPTAGAEGFVVEMEYASTPDIIKGLRESALYLRLTPYTKKRYAPVNANATPEARALLQRLYKTVEEGKIISGLHHNQLQMPNYRRDLNRIDDASGKEPLIWGGDVAWDAAKVVEMATEQYSRGHIITLMWHAGRPFDRGIVNFKQQTQGSFTDQQWKELITEGSEMHQLWIAQVDSIAEYLKILQDRHIPIIWRPLHEMNGEWFWWGNRPGADGYQKVWRMLYDRLTNYHHLNNLLWVWNANAVRETPGDRAMKLDDYYPGSDCVDILATDVYHRDWRQCHHDDLAKLADGKLIALGELGSLPTPEQLAGMPKFAWFMVWTNFTEEEYNTLPQLNDIFSLPNVINFEGAECIAQYDFINGKGGLRNDASIETVGDKQILNLGSNEGFYDLTPEMGRLIKSLNDFTFSVYYKVDGSNPLDGYGHFIFACSELSENGPEEGPYVAFRLNEQRFEVSTGGYKHEEYIMQGGKPERDVWHHALFRQMGHKGEFYIDGQLIGTNDNMPYLSSIFSHSPQHCWIGKAPFKGDKYLTETLVANMCFFNYALSETEIQQFKAEMPE